MVVMEERLDGRSEVTWFQDDGFRLQWGNENKRFFNCGSESLIFTANDFKDLSQCFPCNCMEPTVLLEVQIE